MGSMCLVLKDYLAVVKSVIVFDVGKKKSLEAPYPGVPKAERNRILFFSFL